MLPLGTTGSPVVGVQQDGLPLGPFAVVAEVGGHQVLGGDVGAVALGQAYEEGQVGVGAHVVVEERHLAVDEVLAQDHLPHRHGQRRIGARLGGEPLVGELRVVGVVGADRDDLGAAVADLGHPVRVRGARDRDVGAPHHEVGRVPPVAGLGDVGLVAEHLRAGDGQVGVPVVERRHHAADELDEPGADAVGHDRHRRDRGEACAAIGAVRLDRVHVRGGHDLDGLVPARCGRGRPCRGPAGSGGDARGHRRRRPRPGRGRRGAPWPRGTSRRGRRVRTGSEPGWGSRCTS